jgi:hypothetical protein
VKGAFTIIVKKSILGAKVVNAEHKDLGTIERISWSISDNRVAYAILSFGGFLGMGDKHFAIPWEALCVRDVAWKDVMSVALYAALWDDLSEKIALWDVDKDRLRNASGFARNNWPDMADRVWGARVYRHYGYEPCWERTGGAVEKPNSRASAPISRR